MSALCALLSYCGLSESFAVGPANMSSRPAGCSAHLSFMSRAPACPPPPLNCSLNEAGAAMAVTTPSLYRSFSSRGPCSMCSSTKAETWPLAILVFLRISCK